MRERTGFFTTYRGALLAALAVCIFLAAKHLIQGAAWIGGDTDDAMRMVEVRDLLAGQGWFDHFQYRLGLDGGTSMHWSRIVDAPVAALVMFFSLFVSSMQAQQYAVFIWPMLMIFPTMIAISVAAERFGGREAMLPSYFMTAFFIMLFPRFAPGSIDHHNVQLALVAIMAAGILDRRLETISFAAAGATGAVAVAVGAETLPIVAICCACVALVWAHNGALARRAATGFAGAFSLSLVFLYFTNIGPSEYTKVYCDAYSAGFFSIGLIGSALLWLSAASISRKSMLARYAALAGIAVACAVTAKLIAPECLEKPYSTLDPLLKSLWLDHVNEAQSIYSMIVNDPFHVTTFYGTPIVALFACAWMAWKGPRTVQLFTVSVLVAAPLAVSMYQVRGASFSLMLCIIPLSLMVARAREGTHKPNAVLADHLKFIFACLVSLPFVWAFGGYALKQQFADKIVEAGESGACNTPEAMAALAAQPPGLVASISNIGAHMLLYTDHRVLTAPYHRNPTGMLAGLRISTLPPPEAEKVARKDGVTIIAVCPGDAETRFLAEKAPDGLLANLKKGDVPAFLDPVPGTEDASLRLYRLKPHS
jgi:hypothetical protein